LTQGEREASGLRRFTAAFRTNWQTTTLQKFMDEKPKSIWKKSWKGFHWLRAWLIVVAATFFTVLIVTLFIPGGPRSLSDWWPALVFTLLVSVVVATVFVGLWAFIRCFFCWRNFKRLLFGTACLATFIALFYAEEDWRGWHTWNQFKHEWEAKGEKFDLKDFIPPPVPDDQNFAMTPVVFTCYGQILTRDGKIIDQRDTNWVNRLGFDLGDNGWNTNGTGYWAKGTMSNLKLWQDWYRELAAKTNLFAIPSQPQSPAADVLLALSKYDASVEDLRQASQLPECRFPLNYDAENPATIYLPHLAAMKRSSRLLQLRAIAELENGQSEKALEDVKLSLRLADAIRTEPFLISHLVRIAMVNLTLQPIYEGLAEHRWSDEQLVALAAELAKLNFLSDYKLSMRGEMGCQGGDIDFVIRNRRELVNLTDNSLPVIPPRINSSIPTGWFYQNQLRCARMMVKFYIPLADANQQTISPTAARHADEVLSAETKTTTPYNILEKMLLPALGSCVKKFAHAQSSVDLARVAIALERYRLAHGAYPESLDMLVPQFIAKLPHDIINGQPLHYRRTLDGQLVLYSVGWNETDDGGVVEQRVVGVSDGRVPIMDISTGDWVWRYPAT
jgi:hypothetical protein